MLRPSLSDGPTPRRISGWDRSREHTRRGTPCTAGLQREVASPRISLSLPCCLLFLLYQESQMPTHQGLLGPTDALPWQHSPRREAREEPGESPAAHSLPEAVQCCEHHVCGVQRVDEVGGKGVLLLHSVRFPAGQSRAQRSWGISGPKMTALAQRQCHPSLGVRGLPWTAPKPCCSIQLSAAQGDNGSSGTP